MERRDFIGGILALAVSPFAWKHAPELPAVVIEDAAEPAALFPYIGVTSSMVFDTERLSEFEREWVSLGKVPWWRDFETLDIYSPRTTDR